MSQFTLRTWDVPQVPTGPQPTADGRDPEDFGLFDDEALDPGPLGLVAARIQLFDGRGRAWSRSDPSVTQLAINGATAKGKGSRSLAYQSAAKKTKKSIPESSALSKVPAASRSLAEVGPDSGRPRGAARLSGIFTSAQVSKETEKVEELYQKLASFSLYGLPRLPDDLRDRCEIREGEESGICLQNSWKDIVTGHETMSRKERHQQEAMWELLQTEATYLKKLKIITDLFISGLLNLQASGFLQEVDPNRLFSNIQEIVYVHRALWQDVMSPVLEEARASGKSLDPVRLCLGFRTFPQRFHSYLSYCLSEAQCLHYAHVTQQNNKLFAMYIKWAETHKQSSRMRLNDMLVKPHQRLTKYPLLLKAILKKTEESVAKETIKRTIATVESFIRWIDSQMQFREEQQKLAVVAGRIRLYDVVEGSSEEVERNVKEFSTLDLTLPMVGMGPDCIRQLLFEGSLKMRERKDSKIEVHCLLFTDIFLITKPLKKADRSKVIRQPLMIEKIVARELKDPGSFLLMYVNELHCVVGAYTFQASSSSLCKEWTDCLSAAQKQLELLRSRDVWFCHQKFKQIQEEQETGKHSATSSPITPRRGPSVGETSSKPERVGAIPQLVVWAPGEPEFGVELEPESEAPESEEGPVSPASPGLHRPRSPGRYGAQRFFGRRLRRSKGPKWAQPEEDPEIQAQASDKAEAEPEEGPEIKAQASDLDQAQPEEGPAIHAQASDRAEAEPEEGPKIQAQAQPEVGPDLQAPDWAQAQPEEEESWKAPGPGSVMETLRRAKAMESRPQGAGSKVGDTVEMENRPMTSSRQRMLTLVELQRIRSPLNLNSTLTTSEV